MDTINSVILFTSSRGKHQRKIRDEDIVVAGSHWLFFQARSERFASRFDGYWQILQHYSEGAIFQAIVEVRKK